MDVWVGAQCVPAQTAADLVYGGSPAALGVEPPSLVRMARDSSGTWVVQRWESGSLVASWAAPEPTLSPCDPGEQVADGAALALACSLVLAVGFIARQMRRAL